MAYASEYLRKFWALAHASTTIALPVYFVLYGVLGTSDPYTTIAYQTIHISCALNYLSVVIRCHLIARGKKDYWKTFEKYVNAQETPIHLIMSIIWALYTPIPLTVITYPLYSPYHFLTFLNNSTKLQPRNPGTGEPTGHLQRFLSATANPVIRFIFATEILLTIYMTFRVVTAGEEGRSKLGAWGLCVAQWTFYRVRARNTAQYGGVRNYLKYGVVKTSAAHTDIPEVDKSAAEDKDKKLVAEMGQVVTEKV